MIISRRKYKYLVERAKLTRYIDEALQEAIRDNNRILAERDAVQQELARLTEENEKLKRAYKLANEHRKELIFGKIEGEK